MHKEYKLVAQDNLNRDEVSDVLLGVIYDERLAERIAKFLNDGYTLSSDKFITVYPPERPLYDANPNF